MLDLEIPGYVLTRKLGEGGMGEVYEARQATLDRLVAIKFLPPELSRDEGFVARFRAEARAAARLNHPGIVRVYDAGEVEGVHYIVMEHVAGRSLAARLDEEGRLGNDETLAAGIAIATALRHAWDTAQIIHRDIKPDNVLVAADGTLKVADLGLAKMVGSEESLTVTGTAMGTPHYCAPEQARGERDLDVRVDVYSLGATLYHLVTGVAPFGGEDGIGVMVKHITSTIPDPATLADDVRDPLAWVIEKAMVKEREHRYPDWDAVLRDLEGARAGEVPFGDLPAGATSTVQRRPERAPARDGGGSTVLAPGTPGPPAVEEPPPPPEVAAAPAAPHGPTPRLPPVHPPREPAPGRASAVPRWALALAALVLVGAAAGGVGWALRSRGPALKGPPLVVAFTPYLPRDVMERTYDPFLRYLERRLRRPVRMHLASSYEGAVDDVVEGRVDVADMSASLLLAARARDPGITPIAVTVVQDFATYESYLIVPRDSKVHSIADLRGKRMCWVDPSSTSGYLVPRSMIREAGFDPDSLFGSVTFSGNHHEGLKEVAAGRCDVAPLGSTAYLTANQAGVDVAEVRILRTSLPIPVGAYCAASKVPLEWVEWIRLALLELDVEAEFGRSEFSEEIPITAFGPVDMRVFDELGRSFEADLAARRAADAAGESGTDGGPGSGGESGEKPGSEAPAAEASTGSRSPD